MAHHPDPARVTAARQSAQDITTYCSPRLTQPGIPGRSPGTAQRRVPADRQQTLPYGAGAELGETEEFDRPSSQFLAPGASALLRRRVLWRSHVTQQLRELRRHVRGQFVSGTEEIDVEEHRIGHTPVVLDRAQVHQRVEHHAQIPVGVLEPHPVLEVRPVVEPGGHRPELRQTPSGAVRHRRRILLRDRVDRGKGVLKHGTTRIRQLRGMQKTQQRTQCARRIAAFLSGKFGDRLRQPDQQQLLHMPRLPQPQPAVNSHPVPVLQHRLDQKPVDRQPPFPRPTNQPVDQQPASCLELLLGPGLEPHPHEPARPTCPQRCLPRHAVAEPQDTVPAEKRQPTTGRWSPLRAPDPGQLQQHRRSLTGAPGGDG